MNIDPNVSAEFSVSYKKWGVLLLYLQTRGNTVLVVQCWNHSRPQEKLQGTEAVIFVWCFQACKSEHVVAHLMTNADLWHFDIMPGSVEAEDLVFEKM